jgi:hypothetical protein
MELSFIVEHGEFVARPDDPAMDERIIALEERTHDELDALTAEQMRRP